MNQRLFKLAVAFAAIVVVVLVGAQFVSVNRADSGTAPAADDNYFQAFPWRAPPSGGPTPRPRRGVHGLSMPGVPSRIRASGQTFDPKVRR